MSLNYKNSKYDSLMGYGDIDHVLLHCVGLTNVKLNVEIQRTRLYDITVEYVS